MNPAPDPMPNPAANPFGPPPPYPPPPPRSPVGALFSWLGGVVRGLWTVVNLLLLVLVLVIFFALLGGLGRGEELRERFYGGNAAAPGKIAVIRVEGVLFEGLTKYAVQQINQAAADDQVKAVVLRVVSPGGTITASDDLHQRLGELRSGKNPRHPGSPKPIIVSMGSIAASGGYYIAMINSDPPTIVLAEPTTITGSIGVYASFPNVEKLADKIGVELTTLKAGDLKTSGSPFHGMRDEERQTWQHMVDRAYLRFLDVVAEGRRPQLTRDKLQEDIVLKETLPVRAGQQREKHVDYRRYRADGGIFTADQALQFQLVDRIGYLNDAVREAAKLAGLDQYQAITYDRPRTLFGSLLGVEAAGPSPGVGADGLASAAAPRLWYLAPQHELTGMLTAAGR
jgi:protease-4